MHSAAKRIAIGAAVLAVAVTAACVDATRSTSTEPALQEGAPVSLTGNIQVSADINGKVSSAVRQWSIDGVIKDGVAMAEKAPGQRVDNMVMPALAVAENHPLARRRPNESFATTTKDKNGTHDFVFRAGRAGGPASSIAVLDNGKIAQVFSYDWQRVRGGWVAKGFAVTVFKDGKPILTARSGTKLAPRGPSMMMGDPTDCYLDPNCDPWVGDGGAGGGAGGGGGYYGPCSCANELGEYLNAAWAMGMATQAAIETGLAASPWTLMALGGGWVYVGWKLWQYNSCVQACRQQTGMIETPRTFLASVAAPTRLASCSVLRA